MTTVDSTAGVGFTAAFEALALVLCRELPVRPAAALLRCSDKQLWLRIAFCVEQARALEDSSGVEIVGIDETSLRRGQDCITVAKGAGLALPNAAINCDRFHLVAMAIDAMDLVRRAEMRDEPSAVDAALGDTDRKTLKRLRRGRVVVAPRLLQWATANCNAAATVSGTAIIAFVSSSSRASVSFGSACRIPLHAPPG